MPEMCINNCDGFEQPHSGSESARVNSINDWAKQVKTSNLHVACIINLHKINDDDDNDDDKD